MEQRIPLQYTVGYSDNFNTSPLQWFPAKVPGAVQLDFARAQGWESYTFGDNYKQYAFMEDCFWTYRAYLPKLPNGSVYFHSEGIDYRFMIRFLGKVIWEQEGMFTPVDVELPNAKEGDLLEIILYPIPKRAGARPDRQQADACVKPACSYGWDWHPRLVPSGIWDDTYLAVRTHPLFETPQTRYTLSEDFSYAVLTLDCDFPARWTVTDPKGNLVFCLENQTEALIEHPLLWWCNGQGEQNLYTSTVERYEDGQRKIQKIGFRRIRLIMDEHGWDEPPEGVHFPAERKHPPMTLELNGRVIFGKGSNWIQPEIFYGTITRDTYLPLLKLAKKANMNLLRCWGGQIIQKECFYELCDELGLMVWQEFPLSCNCHPDDPHYLHILDQESRSVIRRLRVHPCLVLWCGGNELFCSWSRMTEQSLALRLLNRNCFDLDPGTPFLFTSPLMGVGHGPYTFRTDFGQDIFQLMNAEHKTAYCEFGIPSPSSPEYIAAFIPKDLQKMPEPGTPWQTHHAYNVISQHGWLQLHNIEHYFGKQNNYQKIYELGSWLQSAGYQAFFEGARRQKPNCSMALNWCYNEPWPSAANNNIINYPALPKPAYEAVTQALRPILVSAQFDRFDYYGGDLFTCTLWLLNDSCLQPEPGSVEVLLFLNDKEYHLGRWNYTSCRPNTNLKGETFSIKLPVVHAKEMKLFLKADAYSSVYRLYYAPQKQHSDL